MPKPTVNEVAKRVLETGGIRKQELMEEYALNRFEADILMKELTDKGIIEYSYSWPWQKESGWSPTTVSREDCDYLGIDISKVDFEKETLKGLKDKIIHERCPDLEQTMRYVRGHSPCFIPVDGNKTRMMCGDLRTGDKVIISVSETTTHPIYGMSKAESLSYKFCYNGRVEMTQGEYGNHYKWVEDESLNGWGLSHISSDGEIKNYDKLPYKILSIASDLLGKPVVNMDYAFAQSEISSLIASIPPTVKSIEGIFYGSRLYRCPELPPAIENVKLAFGKCCFLEKLENLPSNIDPEQLKIMLTGSPNTSLDEIFKMFTALDKPQLAHILKEDMVSDFGILENEGISILEQPSTDEIDKTSLPPPTTEDFEK